MNYTELVTAIQDYTQTDETIFNNNIDTFIVAAENDIFSAMEGPLYWTNSASVIFSQSTSDYALPLGSIDVLSVFINTTAGNKADGSEAGAFRSLERRDYSFLAEAYPGTAAGRETGTPKVYAVTRAELVSGELRLKVDVGPKPDGQYFASVEYYGKSTTDSITNGAATKETWISVFQPAALLYGALIHAGAFLQLEQETRDDFSSKFAAEVALLKQVVEGRQATDNSTGQTNPPTVSGNE
jgi:hypothetical protein